MNFLDQKRLYFIKQVLAFRSYFRITENSDPDLQFKLDTDENVVASWQGRDYILTNRRNPELFLSVSTKRHKEKYPVQFLRAIKLMPARTPPKTPAKAVKAGLSFDEQLDRFRKSHGIPDNANLPSNFKLADGKLSTLWKSRHKKPLAKSTLQSRYGAKFLKDLKIPTTETTQATTQLTIQPTTKPITHNELDELPFNQFRYDQDFNKAL